MQNSILDERIESSKNEMVKALSKMISIKSIAPLSGGDGESKRAEFLKSLLNSLGLKPRRYTYIDTTGTKRPNLVVKYGNRRRTIWIVSHIDTVSEGDRSFWKTDPFKAAIKNGRIYGRGAADNGQAAASSIYALKAIMDLRVKTKYNFGIALVADEEIGSKYGIQKLLKEGIFSKSDMFIVPDGGAPKGDKIEVAEKGSLWLKITILGKQVHASTPDKGVNAYRYAIRLLNALDIELHRKYNRRDGLFEPPESTFEMTKHEKNVDSTNIIPGVEVSYLDCRLLPQYSIDTLLADIKKISKRKEFGAARISFEILMREDAAPITGAKSEIVQLLSSVIKRKRGITANIIGVGGGTCAAFFRRTGMPAVVWGTWPNVEHEPNEYAVIDNMVEDSKVFAALVV